MCVHALVITILFTFRFTAKKAQKQVFVSYNFPATDLQLLALVEKRVLEEMNLFPDKF